MRLEDVCTVFADGDWIESKDQSEEGIRLVQTGNIGEGIYLEKESRAKYISEYTFKRLKCTEIFAGDILVSRLPEPVGRACIIPNKAERMITAVDCTICRPDENLISKEYLCYFMRSNTYYTRLLGSVTGTTRKRISRKNLGNVELRVPSKEEQKSVVERLDCLVKVIDTRERELQLLDDLIKARFVEMFGDPENISYKWPVAKLSEFCDLQNGYAFKSQDYLDNSSVFNCRMSNIRPDGGFDAEYHPKYLPDVFWEKYKEYRLVDGDVIIAMTDMANDPKILGVPTIVRTNGKRFLLNQRVGKLTFYGDKIINNVYLMFVLSQKHIRQQLVQNAGGSTQINVGKSAVLGVEFFVPPMELQNQFATFVEQIDKSKVAVQKALDEAQLLFDSLMQEYFG